MVRHDDRMLQIHSKMVATHCHRMLQIKWRQFLKKINPNYIIQLRGLEGYYGVPVILHAWVEEN